AANAFLRVSLLFDDVSITPRALERAYRAQMSAGMEEEADATLNSLRTRFPEYQLSEVRGMAP
ncbi:MAG: hypothetical protein SNJ52_02670, partial [Verrucomicrobiia bacterium]